YIQTDGPTALAYHEYELIGHGTNYHAHGFGSPVGKLKNINIAIENMSPYDLEAYKIKEGEMTRLEFEGGITVEGEVITGTRNRKGKVLIVSFKNCTVKHYDEVLFHPDWGVYDMAIGKSIVSAYAGPADFTSFDMITHQLETKVKKLEIPIKEQKLRELYEQVRSMRENNLVKEEMVSQIFETLKSEYPTEWLLPVEIYELAFLNKYVLQQEIKDYLNNLAKQQKEVTHLIEDGIHLSENPVISAEPVSST